MTSLKTRYPDKLGGLNPFSIYKGLNKIMTVKSSTMFDFVIAEKKRVKNKYYRTVNGYRIMKRTASMSHIKFNANTEVTT